MTGLAAAGRRPLITSLYRLALSSVLELKKQNKKHPQTEEQRQEAELKLDVGDEPNSWCFSFFFNIYLINQLPTACCGGFGRAAALSCSTGLTSPRRRSGPRPTLVQYCNMCALKPCQRIVTYCVMPFVFCSVLLGGDFFFFYINVSLSEVKYVRRKEKCLFL